MSILSRAGESRNADELRTIYAQPQARLNTLQLPVLTLERRQTYSDQPEQGASNLIAEIDV